MNCPIYLDYNATTPVDPAVVEALVPWLHERFGNPSSTHAQGRQALAAVEQAREQVAELIGASADEILFTGSATEANNLALLGVARASKEKGRHLVISAVEHPSVTAPGRMLEAEGWQLTRVPVEAHGRVDPDAVADALTPQTVLVSIMLANNETGTLQPIEEIAALTGPRGVLLHVDAAQAVGKIPLSLERLGADLLTIAGHKFYAPKGIGALWMRSGTPLVPLYGGGGQERGLRPGTENVPFIVALGKAAELAKRCVSEEGRRLRGLRDQLHLLLESEIPGLALNGHPEQRLPGTLNLSFPGVDGRELLARLGDGLAASVGSACHEENPAHQGVLAAMGLSESRIRGAVRLSLGRFTTRGEIERAAELLTSAWRQITSSSTRQR